MQYIRITDKTLKWFRSLLPMEFLGQRQEKNMYILGAIEDGTACGVLVFQIRRDLADIRYLAVSEAYRRKGAARGMIGYLCQYAWPTATPVACTFSAADKNSAVYLLFAEMEHFSVAEEEGYHCRVSLEGLSRNPALAALRERGRAPCPFFSLPAGVRREFFLKLINQDIYYLQGVRDDDFIRPLCLCTVSQKGITAAVFISQREQDLELACAWCAPGGSNDLMGLLAKVCVELPQEGVIWIAAVTPVSAAIVDKLLPDRKIVSRYYRAVWDMER